MQTNTSRPSLQLTPDASGVIGSPRTTADNTPTYASSTQALFATSAPTPHMPRYHESEAAHTAIFYLPHRTLALKSTAVILVVLATLVGVFLGARSLSTPQMVSAQSASETLNQE